MTSRRNTTFRSAIALMAAAWLLAVVLCPPMYRMHCLVTGRTVVSLYAPVSCGPQQGSPLEHTVSPQCCEFSKIAVANSASEPVALMHYTAVSLAVPAVLAMELVLPRGITASPTYNGHGPPRLIAMEGQAGLGVFRI